LRESALQAGGRRFESCTAHQPSIGVHLSGVEGKATRIFAGFQTFSVLELEKGKHGKRKVERRLYLRYRTPEGKQSPPRPVAWDSKSRLRPGWCMVGGVAEHHPDASYRLRYKRDSKQAWGAAGTDPNTALSLRASCAIRTGGDARMILAKSLGEAIVPGRNVAKPERRYEDNTNIGLCN
jgi:hypothetical protein